VLKYHKLLKIIDVETVNIPVTLTFKATDFSDFYDYSNGSCLRKW